MLRHRTALRISAMLMFSHFKFQFEVSTLYAFVCKNVLIITSMMLPLAKKILYVLNLVFVININRCSNTL